MDFCEKLVHKIGSIFSRLRLLTIALQFYPYYLGIISFLQAVVNLLQDTRTTSYRIQGTYSRILEQQATGYREPTPGYQNIKLQDTGNLLQVTRTTSYRIQGTYSRILEQQAIGYREPTPGYQNIKLQDTVNLLQDTRTTSYRIQLTYSRILEHQATGYS